MAIYRVDYFKTSNSKYVMVEANSKREAINKAIEEKHWQKYPVDFFTFNYTATLQDRKPKNVSPVWVSVKDELPPVSYTHLTLPTIPRWCRSRWSPYH